MSKQFVKGRLRVPGDKSITHRALLFSVFSRGECEIVGASPAHDCQSTAQCLQQLGLRVNTAGSVWTIDSPGLEALKAPEQPLQAGNSGTTMRLLSGLLAGRSFESVLDGDESLRRRPMGRVLKPLASMGAGVRWLDQEGFAPFALSGGGLKGISVELDVASAQVQTAIVLAGLQASGRTTVRLPSGVRDHTRRMFSYVGIPFEQPDDNTLSVSALESRIDPYRLDVPADISSAAFFMVAASLLPGSELLLTDLSLDPGRTLVIDVLQEMGGDVQIVRRQERSGEPVGDVLVRGVTRLGGTVISGRRLARGVDEIPILSLAGALCQGEFTVLDAGELRVKETDRIFAIVQNLRRAGATVEESGDGFKIIGQEVLAGGSDWSTFGDHRMAMTGLVASAVAAVRVSVDDLQCIDVSYPGFQKDFGSVFRRV